jgi:hypothetical protein
VLGGGGAGAADVDLELELELDRPARAVGADGDLVVGSAADDLQVESA